MINLINKLAAYFLSTKEEGMLLVGTSRISRENLSTEWEIPEEIPISHNEVSKLQERISKYHSIYFEHDPEKDRFVNIRTTYSYSGRYFLGYKFEEIIEQETIAKYENK